MVDGGGGGGGGGGVCLSMSVCFRFPVSDYLLFFLFSVYLSVCLFVCLSV